jgi:hypothetical protein
VDNIDLSGRLIRDLISDRIALIIADLRDDQETSQADQQVSVPTDARAVTTPGTNVLIVSAQ